MGRKECDPEEQARRAKIRELLEVSQISSMDDIQNLFKETIAEFMEEGLDAELFEELGYSIISFRNKYSCSGVIDWKMPAMVFEEAIAVIFTAH